MDDEIEERYENLKRLYEELDNEESDICKTCPFGGADINKPKLHEPPKVIKDYKIEIMFVGINPSNKRNIDYIKTQFRPWSMLTEPEIKASGKTEKELGMKLFLDLDRRYCAYNDAPLFYAFKLLDIDRENVFITNLVKCAKIKNNKSNINLGVVERCKSFLEREIELVKPKLVIFMTRDKRYYRVVDELRNKYKNIHIDRVYHPGYYRHKGILKSHPELRKDYAKQIYDIYKAAIEKGIEFSTVLDDPKTTTENEERGCLKNPTDSV